MEADEAFVKDFNFSRCFLIMDNMIDNEMAKPEEIPLFFYPPSRGDEGLSKQLSAISVCMAMSSICLHFTHVPVSVVELKEVKIAYKKIDQYTLVLTGLVTDSNKALLHQINLLWDCFQFYNGSFGRIEKLSGPNRASLQKNVAQAATFLVPLIQEFHSTSMKFSPMPYTKVAPSFKDTSTYFVLAWQLTSAIHNNPSLKDSLCGTALIFNNRVVCTHLDVASTRWIVSFIQYLGSTEGQNVIVSNTSTVKIPDGKGTESEATLNFREFCFPVFVEQSLVEKHVSLDGVTTKLQFNGDLDDHLLSDSEDEGSDYLYDSSSESSSKRPTSSTYEYKEDEVDGTRVRVGLYVITLEGGLSVATLMTWPSFLSKEPMPHMIQSLYQYYSLVKHLTDTLNSVCEVEKAATKKRYSATGSNVTLTASSGSNMSNSGSLPNPNTAEPSALEAWLQQRNKTPEGVDEDCKVLPRKPQDTQEDKPYNFFAFDEITEMQNVHFGVSNKETTASFSSSINWAHDLFSEHPEATKVVLRNHTGSVLCRKYFGKETFFQTTTEKFEDVELVASHFLGSDRSAGFI